MVASGCALGSVIAAILACLGGLLLIPVGVESGPIMGPPPMVVTAELVPTEVPIEIMVTLAPTEDAWYNKPVEATPTP